MAGRKGVGVFAVGSGAADGGLDSLGQNVVENPRLSQAEGECPIPLVVVVFANLNWPISLV
jgi:hypothetical protein